MAKLHTLYLRFRKRFRWLFPSHWQWRWQYKRYCARYPEKVRKDGCIDTNDLCWLEFIGKPELHDKTRSFNIGFEPSGIVVKTSQYPLQFGYPPICEILGMRPTRKASGQYEGGKYNEYWRKPNGRALTSFKVRHGWFNGRKCGDGVVHFFDSEGKSDG